MIQLSQGSIRWNDWINFWGANSVRIPTSLGKVWLPAVPRGQGWDACWWSMASERLSDTISYTSFMKSPAVYHELTFQCNFLQTSFFVASREPLLCPTKTWLELQFRSWQDVLKIMRHFDSRKDGQVSYNEFCDALPLVQRSQFEVSSLEIKVEKDAKNGGAKNFRLGSWLDYCHAANPCSFGWSFAVKNNRFVVSSSGLSCWNMLKIAACASS